MTLSTCVFGGQPQLVEKKRVVGGAHAPSASQRAYIVALTLPASSARTEGVVVCGRPRARLCRACSAFTIGRRRLRPDGDPLS